MTSTEATNLPGSGPSRKRKPYERTPQALAAMRANLAKARAAPKEVIYRPTERRQAASRANIRKAIAARKTPEGNAAARLNALKHGLFAERVEESAGRLNEDPKEVAELVAEFERIFAPEDDAERKIVRRLGLTAWRRLRLYNALARREIDALKRTLAQAPRVERLTADETHGRALELAGGLVASYDILFKEGMHLQSKIESLLRALLRKRSGGKIQFKYLCGKRDFRIPELEDPVGDTIDKILLLHETPEGQELLRKIAEQAGFTSQPSAAGSQKTEARSQGSEVRSQESE